MPPKTVFNVLGRLPQLILRFFLQLGHVDSAESECVSGELISQSIDENSSRLSFYPSWSTYSSKLFIESRSAGTCTVSWIVFISAPPMEFNGRI